jgi:catechol 2,3-dioxygenase-like lactoylglutathione lyase family enzyme
MNWHVGAHRAESGRIDMANYHLNHVNIRTADLKGTRDFYADVLGLEEGFRPPFPNPGHWMYAGDMPVIHISPCEPESPIRTNPDGFGKGLDHFAMWGDNLTEQLATLDSKGIPYEKRLAGGGRVVQVFFNDPNGITIELGFNPENEGVTRDNFDGPIYEKPE